MRTASTLFAALLTMLAISRLAAAEDEFKPLFNGTDLAGWEAVDSNAENWTVADGVLSTSGQGGGWLSTDKEYANFELSLEFRVPKGGNSGVFLRAPRDGRPWLDGMEIQVLDDYADEYKSLQPYQYCASLYGVVPAEPRVSKPADEWQTMRIRADGSKLTITLNDTVVVDTDLAAHPDKDQEHPGLKRPAGYIGLQCHSTPLDFRNIKLRVLP